ncbi:HTH-type transcriptional repressor Bm3R1 [Corynebacterium kalinowskii]|uniref:HTH-type transcriptional repressor Bm3R1 n=1 Tax=Corynebacterium kalinowskii TaxID=2675216 RepID=A0A6B8VRP5_9CORY|nr:TetR family transcriptional regulator [Corynebacterium kalinowskii]QGU01426.1 HTH-type transcriptional repressor Bm3R1 [Corynebacterium kalinowskii]
MAGLRERKKAAAMRNIQSVAIELFREHGFDNVKIEDIATAAETSPSSIYRYFGTKEGLVLHDEFDDSILNTFSQCIHDGRTVAEAASIALERIGHAHFVTERDSTLFRFELWMNHPAIQAAAALHLLKISDQVALLLHETGEYTLPEANFVAAATINGFIAAIRSWQADGATGSAEEYVMNGLQALGRALG